jgi:hypothetical protein
MNRHLNSERQECNTGHLKGRELLGSGGYMKRVKEGEYG